MNRFALLSVVPLAVACAPTVSEEISRGQQVQALTSSNDLVSYPVKAAPSGTEPLLDSAGRVVVSWTGSVPDLLATDAWAGCAKGVPTDNIYLIQNGDAYIRHLTKLVEDLVPNGGPLEWEQRRANPAYNASTSSNRSQPVLFPMRPRDAYLLGNPPVEGASPERGWTINAAQAEMDLADVNLCMAQQLREDLVGPKGLLLSAAEHREMLAIIRERAQLAMLQLMLIGQAIATESEVADSVTTKVQFLPVLRVFGRDPANASKVATLGRDLAAAIELHGQITSELAEAFLRSAFADEPIGPGGNTRADREWGPGSWRARLLKLLYGGDPLRAANGNLWGTFPGTTGDYDIELSHFTLPAHGPVTPPEAKLLALARRADALYVKRDDVGYDAATSSTRLWRAAEAYVRHPECGTPGASVTCEALATSADVPAPSDYGGSVLWQRYGVAPQDAVTLLAWLIEALPTRDRLGAVRALGAHELLDGVTVGMRLPGESGVWAHLDPALTVIPNDPAERITSFLTDYRTPFSIDKWNTGEAHGFIGLYSPTSGGTSDLSNDGNARMRTLGTISALIATRDGIFNMQRSLALAPSPAAARFLEGGRKALPLLRAAVGAHAVTVRPKLQPSLVFDVCQEWELGVEGMDWRFWCYILAQVSPDGDNVTWDVAVTTTADDPFTRLSVTPPDVELGHAVAMPSYRGPLGTSGTQLLSTAPAVTPTWTEDVEGGLVRRHYEITTAPGASIALVASTAEQAPAYKVLATGLRLNSSRFAPSEPGAEPFFRSNVGKYIGFGGTLGTLAERAWMVRESDWTAPAFDPFGLPTDWIPSSDPSVFGGASGESPSSYYQRAAHSAAGEAATAVREAVTELLRQAADDVAANTARQRAAGVANLEARALCGDRSRACDTSTTVVSVGDAHVFPSKTCTGTACESFWRGVRAALPRRIRLASAVAQRLGDQSAPSFNEYGGGTLQGRLVDQWNALRKIFTIIREADSTLSARAAAIAAAETDLANSAGRQAWACSREAFDQSVEAGRSYSHKGYMGVALNDDGSGSVTLETEGMSWSPGPWFAQREACEEAKRTLDHATADKATVVAEGWAASAAYLAQVSDAAGMFQHASAELAQTIQEARLATARAELEADLDNAGLVTRFGLYRRIHSDDLWRARKKVVTARKLAVMARRAVESRFVVRLDTMNASEQLVGPPATWANAVYAPDLAMRNVTGATLGGAPAEANRLVDYVEDLQLFVQGWAASRPTLTVKADSEVLAFGGPASADAARSWSFQCVNDGPWLANPLADAPNASLATMCGDAAPKRARAVFRLDPWARLQGTGERPYERRFNVRWNRFAVNLTGSMIRDCGVASNPAKCAANPYLSFDLSSVGPSWVIDYDGQWLLGGDPIVHVEGAKALANERSLGLTELYWGRTEVDGIARSELFDRPVSGEYTLDFELPQEAHPERIETVQILAESAYWVKQR